MVTEKPGLNRRTAVIFAAGLVALALLAAPCPGWGTTAQTMGLARRVSTAAASFSPASLAFGNQSVGARSTAQSITLTNSGGAALSVISIAVSGTNAGDFAQTNDCGSRLGEGAECTISVTFTPAAPGTFIANVTLSDGFYATESAKLTGTGTAPAASLSPSSLTFSSQAVGATSAAEALTLANSGNAALSVTGLGLTGANASAFCPNQFVRGFRGGRSQLHDQCFLYADRNGNGHGSHQPH